MWVNPGEGPAPDGKDNDDNGIVDDIHGADFSVIGKASGKPMDENGHGTHIAGTIGAVGNNGIGVVGVCWNVRLMAVKVIDASGRGDNISIVRGIDYATRQGARVICLALGATVASRSMEDAIDEAGRHGALVVVAAGNNGSDIDSIRSSPTLSQGGLFVQAFPSAFRNGRIVSVISVARNEDMSWFSNYGTTSTDIGAPGGLRRRHGMTLTS